MDLKYMFPICSNLFPTNIVGETILWFLYNILRETTLQELASTRANRYLKKWFMWECSKGRRTTLKELVYSRETKDMFPTNIAREKILWFLCSKLRKTTLQELVYVL